MKELTDYEKKQLDEIMQWKNEEPSVVSKVTGWILKPVSKMVEVVVPNKAIEGVLTASNGIAEFLTDVNDIKRDAKVAQLSELKSKDLKMSDNLADVVHNWAIGIAATEGAATGATGLPGMLVDIPAIITLALRTIHKIGACYGFKSETEEDKKFALAIMSMAGANTMKEKTAALLTLQSVRVILVKQTWKQMAKNAAGKEASIIAIKNLAKQLGINLTKRKALQAIPMLGSLVGASMNVSFITDIAWAARRCYQERWLSENEKI